MLPAHLQDHIHNLFSCYSTDSSAYEPSNIYVQLHYHGVSFKKHYHNVAGHITRFQPLLGEPLLPCQLTDKLESFSCTVLVHRVQALSVCTYIPLLLTHFLPCVGIVLFSIIYRHRSKPPFFLLYSISGFRVCTRGIIMICIFLVSQSIPLFLL